MLSLPCRHGRAAALVWLTPDTSMLKDRGHDYEYQALVRLAEVPAAHRGRPRLRRSQALPGADREVEGGVAPGCRQRRGARPRFGQPVCQALGHQGRIP